MLRHQRHQVIGQDHSGEVDGWRLQDDVELSVRHGRSDSVIHGAGNGQHQTRPRLAIMEPPHSCAVSFPTNSGRGEDMSRRSLIMLVAAIVVVFGVVMALIDQVHLSSVGAYPPPAPNDPSNPAAPPPAR